MNRVLDSFRYFCYLRSRRAWKAARRQLVHHHAECVNVGPGAEAIATEILGRHERKRTGDGVSGRFREARTKESEIDEHRATTLTIRGHDDVVRFDIEMENPPTVEEGQRGGEIAHAGEEIIQVDSFETLAGQNHREDWMKATWSVGPIDASKQSAAQ